MDTKTDYENGGDETIRRSHAKFGCSDVNGTPVVQQTNEVKMSGLRIIKNLVVVSIGFMCLFTSYGSLENLQSTLNREEGLGTNGLVVIYGTLVFSCLFLAPIIISKFGCKWAICFSVMCYILYMAANFYAIYWTIIPSAIILGIAAAPLWSAKCTYITEIAVWYSRQTGASEDEVINRFFGIFFMVYQTSQIWGNLISSLVFKTTTNKTITDDDLLKCGAHFCPRSDDNITNLEIPSLEKVYTVLGIYIGCGVLAVIIIALFLDKIIIDKEHDALSKKFSFTFVLDTGRHFWRDHYQKLLVPLTMYSGIEKAFITGDFTQSYIGCALGIENIGFVMICYGVVDAICSFLFGRLVKFVGHIPFFVLAFMVHGGCQIAFLLWTPDPSKEYLFYIFAGLWGMGDAVIQTQVNALYGLLWSSNSKAAFANFFLWESLGFIIAFASQGYLCTNIKLYMCLGFLCFGMWNYAVVEVFYKERNKQVAETTLSNGQMEPVTTLPNGHMEPVTTLPNGQMEPVTTLSNGLMEPLTALPNSQKEPVKTLQNGQMEPVTTVSNGLMKPVTTLPNGQKEPVKTLPNGQIEPVTTLLNGQIEPVTTLPNGHTEPMTTLSNGHMEPVTTLLNGHMEPLTTLPNGHMKPVTTLPNGHMEPVTTLPNGHMEPVTALPNGNMEPVTTLLNGHMEPLTTLPNGHMEPVTTLPNGHMEPVTTLPNGQMEPAATLPYGQMEPVTTLPNGHMEPVTTLPNGQMEPATTLPYGQTEIGTRL